MERVTRSFVVARALLAVARTYSSVPYIPEVGGAAWRKHRQVVLAGVREAQRLGEQDNADFLLENA